MGLVIPHIRPLREIPTWMSFILSLEVFAAMAVSIKTPLYVLFGGSDRFSKHYHYKVLLNIRVDLLFILSLFRIIKYSCIRLLE